MDWELIGKLWVILLGLGLLVKISLYFYDKVTKEFEQK